MKSVPFASLKGASRLGVLLGILCAGCVINPLEDRVGVLGKGASDQTVDSLPPPDVLPPIEPMDPPIK